MQANGLKVLPCGLLFLLGKFIWQTRHDKQNIRLLNYLIALKPVKAHMVIACTVVGLELGNVYRLKQMEGVVRGQMSRFGVAGIGNALTEQHPVFTFFIAYAESGIGLGTVNLQILCRFFGKSEIVVKFDSCGGSEVASVDAAPGARLQAPARPEREGMAFVGWYTDPNAEIRMWDFLNDRVSGSMTLYAKWLKPDEKHLFLNAYASDKELAKKHFHSTAVDAANCALKCNAGKLVLGHYSSRYRNTDKILEDARAIFPETYCAKEGNVFDIPVSRLL